MQRVNTVSAVNVLGNQIHAKQEKEKERNPPLPYATRRNKLEMGGRIPWETRNRHRAGGKQAGASDAGLRAVFPP